MISIRPTISTSSRNLQDWYNSPIGLYWYKRLVTLLNYNKLIYLSTMYLTLAAVVFRSLKGRCRGNQFCTHLGHRRGPALSSKRGPRHVVSRWRRLNTRAVLAQVWSKSQVCDASECGIMFEWRQRERNRKAGISCSWDFSSGKTTTDWWSNFSRKPRYTQRKIAAVLRVTKSLHTLEQKQWNVVVRSILCGHLARKYNAIQCINKSINQLATKIAKVVSE